MGRFFGSGTDQAGLGQVPGHRGPGHGDVVVVGQVPADGVRAGVQAGRGQLLAQLDDQVDDLGGDRGRGGLGPPERGSKTASPSRR